MELNHVCHVSFLDANMFCSQNINLVSLEKLEKVLFYIFENVCIDWYFLNGQK